MYSFCSKFLLIYMMSLLFYVTLNHTQTNSVHPDFEWFFFLFNHTRIQSIDYGGTQFYPVPVCRPGPKVRLDGSTPAPSADKLSAL